MNNYVVYHLHSDRSLLDSCTDYKLYIDKAKELGQTAICFSEHSNVYNWLEKKMYCDASGIKYIHGVECYLTKALLQSTDDNPQPHKVRDNYHTILIAKNYEGLKEINRLVDASTRPDHMYYKPRISFDEFKAISSNVIKISACLASPLNKLRDESLIQFYDYLEIQPHVNSPEQKEYNVWLVQMSKKYGKPLIAGTDTHSLNAYKGECRKILLKAKKIEYTSEDEFDLTYKSYDELVEMFEKQGVVDKSDYMSAIENTNVMADSVEPFELDKSFKYAKCYEDDEAELKRRVNERYKDKVARGVIKANQQYAINAREELRVFKKIGMLGFMLLMSDLVTWCWDNGIPIGYCRGSCGGSTIAYLTDIIDVDPVVWNTVFSRFANEDRKELGDIDIDISPTQRHLVYDHIIESFGEDYTAYILAMGTLVDKGTIDEIGRALNYPLDEVAAIKDAYEQNPDEAKQKYKELFYYFDGLLGTCVSQSMHPAGIVVSPVSLPDNYGTFWADGKRILQINMEECHEVNLNKYDLLGLKNVEIIKDTCAFAGIPYPKSHLLNWEDENVWKDMLTSPAGIFQFESKFAFEMLKKFGASKINHMSLVNASLRPSGASYRDRLLNHEINHNPSDIIDDLLKDNNGFLIYQEDTIAFLQKICGLSGSEADNIRRAIGRKQKDRLDAALPSILEGYCSKSDKPREVAEEEAKTFLQIIEDSASYQFGYNHSTGYSMIGYTCAYLRYYYPCEFIAAYLNNANNDDDIRMGTELAKVKNISILPPKFRHSRARYVPDPKEHAVYKGVSSIKFLNDDVAEKLYEMRNIEFSSFVDVIRVFPGNSKQLDILIKLDYFSEFGKIGYLLDIVRCYDEFNDKKQYKKDNMKYPDKIVEVIKKHSTETEKQFRVTDPDSVLMEVLDLVQSKDVPLTSRIEWDKEYLGYISITMPEKRGIWVVAEIDTKYSPKLTLFELSTGRSVVAKISKKAYQETPLVFGDTIRLTMIEKPKVRKVDGEWVQSPTETETWLKYYSLCNIA